MRKPLDPRITHQVLVLDGVTVSNAPCWKDGRVCLTVTRQTMEQLWSILHDLQDACDRPRPEEQR